MNLSVLIGTCDKYSSLWENFSICFNRYWQVDTNNIFVGETKEVPNFKTILCDVNRPWGERMRVGLEECSDYIFFILDDYFLHKSFTFDQINTYLQDANTFNINRLQISPSSFQQYGQSDFCPYTSISDTSEYIISMQPSIWKKSFLKEILLKEYSPWDFEIIGSSVANNLRDNKVYIDQKADLCYFNAVRQGFKKSPGWEEFKIQEQLNDF
jgi:hypothetical protein